MNTGFILLAVGAGLLILPKSKQVAFVVLGNSNKTHAFNRALCAAKLSWLVRPDLVVFAGKGEGIDGLSEAAWLHQTYVQLRGLGTQLVDEPTSMSTKQNVELASKLMPRGAIVYVVSDNDHVMSAAWCMRYVYGHDARWVLWPKYGAAAVPPQVPAECERAGCCK